MTEINERDHLDQLLSNAAILVAAEKDNSEESIAKKSLEEQLAQRLHRLSVSNEQQEQDNYNGEFIEKGNEKQAFVQKCLDLLVAIQGSLLSVIENEQEHTEREYIGVRDLRLVHTLLQVIISWGIYPYFLPGVGVPLSKRIKSGYTNHELLSQQDQSSSPSPAACTKEGIIQLFNTTSALVDLISKTHKVSQSKNYTTVGSILLARHLPDLFAGLLQLAYAPVPKSTMTTPNKATVMPTDPSMFLAAAAKSTQTQNHGLARAERDKCARMFAWLFERADVHRCMESLMLLLGTSPLHPVPAWLRNICGRFLSKILLRSNGVTAIIEFTVGDVENVSLGQLEKVSKLILAVPQQMPSVESYYTVIGPQLLALLKDNISGPKARVSTRQVVTFIIGRMITTHTDLTKSLIVEKIIGPLVDSWDQVRENMEEDSIDVISEDGIEQLLNILHQMMVGGEPSPVVIQAFLGHAVNPLYHLYDFTVKSKSGLRETVLDILVTYFRIMSPSEILRDLKAIILSKRDLAGARQSYFAAGPSGGVVLRMSKHMRPLAGNQLPIEPEVMIEFIQKTNSPDICGDFFLFLLNEYTSLQTLSADPRLMLLMLQLIMGMQDKLGTEILSKPEQILAFANNVVTGFVDRLEEAKNTQNKKKSSGSSTTVDIMNIVSEEDREAMDNMPTEDDIENDLESLIMAINLLRAVMHENEELSPRASQSLESSVAPLKQLESYRIQELHEPVHELMLAITSYLSAQKLSGKSKKNKEGKEEGSEQKFLEAMRALQDDLLPVRAHGIGILRDLVLAKDPLVSSGQALDNVLDIFVRLVQDEDSYIYLNAIKGLSALTDIHGNEIIKKLGEIYADEKESLDNRLRVGEALLQTVQRSGDALSLYVGALVKPLEKVLSRRQVDKHLRVSALSILSTACQTCPMALKGFMQPLTNWVLNILEFEKEPEIRRGNNMYAFHPNMFIMHS
ncbi:hypothetical protein BDA99DRAFT_508593 [Phascolomyces articulosus]|uniref:RNA polymerase II assembly factor Rtp1 C-terminal domain-containing protein n=1 Tax=Phascolomyces articulosus TaxID=60185 RepID=A0AAD5PEI9_9FUNG|nr:hypothetical protein BDA99DRAFT_508593 [Phascolomyces articulosus]